MDADAGFGYLRLQVHVLIPLHSAHVALLYISSQFPGHHIVLPRTAASRPDILWSFHGLLLRSWDHSLFQRDGFYKFIIPEIQPDDDWECSDSWNSLSSLDSPIHSPCSTSIL